MSRIERGALLQYKDDHYGKYYPKLPKIPFAQDHQFMDSTHRESQELWALLAAGKPMSEGSGRKKFILFCAKLVQIAHPIIPQAICTYVQCFISDPYVNGETIDGWVRDIWVEPLTELATYDEERKQFMKELYINLKKNGPSKEKTPLEIYQELKKETF